MQGPWVVSAWEKSISGTRERGDVSARIFFVCLVQMESRWTMLSRAGRTGWRGQAGLLGEELIGLASGPASTEGCFQGTRPCVDLHPEPFLPPELEMGLGGLPRATQASPKDCRASWAKRRLSGNICNRSVTAAGQGRFPVSNIIGIIEAEIASDSELDQSHTGDWRRSGREPGGQKPDQFLQD